MDKEKLEWPDVVEETGEKSIVLQQTIVVSRDEFNKRMGRVAKMLLKKGVLGLESTDRVRRYILEFEIRD